MQEHYLKEHLEKYIKFEIEQGYDAKDIKNALIKYGYKKELVNEIFKGIGAIAPIIKKKSVREEMTKEMEFYIQNMLNDYVKKQLENGYSKDAIKKALLKSGHHEDMISNSFNLIKKGKIIDYEVPFSFSLPTNLIFGGLLFLLFVFIVFISIANDENILKVVLTFVPAILTLAIANLLVVSIKNITFARLLPFISVAVCIGLFVLLTQFTQVYIRADNTILLILNILAGFILTAVLCIFSPKGEKISIKKRKGEVPGI